MCSRLWQPGCGFRKIALRVCLNPPRNRGSFPGSGKMSLFYVFLSPSSNFLTDVLHHILRCIHSTAWFLPYTVCSLTDRDFSVSVRCRYPHPRFFVLFCLLVYFFLTNKSYFRERPPTCPGTSEWLAGICLSIGKSNKGVSFSGKDGQAFTWPCLLWIHTW